jgi:diguanylate cyclase (GGDEF)-like protein
MSYHFAPYILAAFGILLSLLGYYLDVIYQIKYEEMLWIGVFLVLSLGGFVAGRLIQKLNVSSQTDFLTGLFNRRYFYLRLNEVEARTIRKKTTVCIAMIDVDGFKRINDTYGHAIGDVLLSDLATILRKTTRTTDIVTRWGGDEFAIIFCETSLETALEVMERIRRKVENTFLPYHLTVSAGIVALKADQDLKNMLVIADQTLYKAKAQKNTVITVNGV